MKAIEIFPRNIYGETFLGFDSGYLQSIEATIELFRRGNTSGREMSNQDFGYQSNLLPHDGVFQNLTDKILVKSKEFLKSLNGFEFSKVELKDMWANINYPGDINWPHFMETTLLVFIILMHRKILVICFCKTMTMAKNKK